LIKGLARPEREKSRRRIVTADDLLPATDVLICYQQSFSAKTLST